MGRITTGSRAAGVMLALAVGAHAVPAQEIARWEDSALAKRAMQFPSPHAATWIAIGSTVVPMAAGAAIAARSPGRAGTALWVSGVLAGPMIGAWYGNTLSDSWSGALVRAGGLAIAAAGAAGCSAGTHSLSGCSTGDETAMFGGAALALGSAIYEIATIGDRVREHNEAEARAMVLPLFSPSMREVGVEVVIGF